METFPKSIWWLLVPRFYLQDRPWNYMVQSTKIVSHNISPRRVPRGMWVIDNSAYPNLRVKTLVPGWDRKIAGKRGRKKKTQNMVIILGFETSPNHLFTASWKLNQPFTKVRHLTFQNVASHFLHCRSPENPDVLTYERVNHNYK